MGLLGSEGICLLQDANASRWGPSPVLVQLTGLVTVTCIGLDSAFLHIITRVLFSMLLTISLTLMPVLCLQYEDLDARLLSYRMR